MRSKIFRITLVLLVVLACGTLGAAPALAAGPADASSVHWAAWSDLGARLIGWWSGFTASAPEHTTAASGHGMDPDGAPQATPSSGSGMDPDGSPAPTPASGGGMDPNG